MQHAHIYEVRPRKDKRGVTLICDVLPFGRLWVCVASQPNQQGKRLRDASDSHLACLSYCPLGAGLYPACIASCSIMYLPFLVVP